MRLTAPVVAPAATVDPDRALRTAATWMSVYAVTLMVLPSDLVFAPLGASGYVASIVALLGLLAWVACCLFGIHDPFPRRNPIRGVVVLMWMVSLVSYALMHLTRQEPEALLAADRWILQLAAATGVVVVCGDMLTSFDRVRQVQRALVWGGAVCGLIAALQFWASFDLTQYIRMLPGLVVNADNTGISSRAALNRVSGTAIHPIELGTVGAMILPLAINLAAYDTARSMRRRLFVVGLVALAIPTSVSRSAILAVTIAAGLYVLLLPPARRLVGLAMVPVAVAGVFLTIPGLMTTLSSFFTAGETDPSIAARVDDYPTVEKAVAQHPWFGAGGGTFLPADAFAILDNQYLKVAIELGLVGVVAFALLMLIPVSTSLLARKKHRDEEIRSLCAALAGSCLAAALCSVTFDSWSFPMFTGVHALILGLIAACWNLVPPRVGSTDDDRLGHMPEPGVDRWT